MPYYVIYAILEMFSHYLIYACITARASSSHLACRLTTKRFATTTPTTASMTASTESAAAPGVRSPKAAFTNAPKPAQKKKTHKIRNTAILTLLAASGFVGAAAYAQEDLEFAQQFEHYVPGATSFMRLIRYHDDSIVMAVSDVGYHMYSDLAYTGRFIYAQFYKLLNMLQHNNWKGAADGEASPAESGRKRDAAVVSKPAAPAAPAAGARKDTIAAGPAPISSIQVAIDIPPLQSDNAVVAELSKNLSAVVEEFNKKGISPSNVQQLKVLTSSLVRLDKYLGEIKAEERAIVEAALAEEQKKFEAVLAEFQDTARAALLAREAELIEARDSQLQMAAAAAEERLSGELASQRDLLERRFNRFVRARVDEERSGRLAHLDRVESQLRQLTQMAQESGDLIRQSRAVAKLSVALSALKSAAVNSKVQTPFASELQTLTSTATTDFPATRAAFAAISRETAELGVPSLIELEDRFEAVRKEIRSVSLVPENGNFGSQVLSATLSKVMFEKEGLVDGDDVEAVLSRSGHYLKLHNLDMAARELNQLKGWPKKLSEDWIAAARRRLEIEQAVSIAESEQLLAKLTLI
ncbi:MICOS complex subunit mic60 [Coemansia sp. Benny D115]|nr:MICOS complex subunit mic60 [Coemansia sp. Benny D115]